MYSDRNNFAAFLLLKVDMSISFSAWIRVMSLGPRKEIDNIIFYRPWRKMWFFSLKTATVASLLFPAICFIYYTFYNVNSLWRFVLLTSYHFPNSSDYLQLFQRNEIPEIGKEYAITSDDIGMDKNFEAFVLNFQTYSYRFI